MSYKTSISRAYLFPKPWDLSSPFDESVVGYVGDVMLNEGRISVEKHNPFITFDRGTTLLDALRLFDDALDRPLTWEPYNVYQQVGQFVTDRDSRLDYVQRYEDGKLTARDMYLLEGKPKVIYGIRKCSYGAGIKAIQNVSHTYSNMDDMSDPRSWPPYLSELERRRAANLWKVVDKLRKASNFMMYKTLDANNNWKRLILSDEKVDADEHDEGSIAASYQYVRAFFRNELKIDHKRS